jgi:hypothetical protein
MDRLLEFLIHEPVPKMLEGPDGAIQAQDRIIVRRADSLESEGGGANCQAAHADIVLASIQ